MSDFNSFSLYCDKFKGPENSVEDGTQKQLSHIVS